MTSYELARTWFPGVRKELIIKRIELLQGKSGVNQIKLSVVMPLSDEKLVGMSSWLGASYDVICKEDSLLTFEKWGHQIVEMVYTAFTADDSPKPSQIFVCPVMKNFMLRRGKQGDEDEDLADINLQFEAYVNDSTELWAWCRRQYRKSIYVKFETTQKELPLGEVPDDKQMKLGESPAQEEDGEDYDAEDDFEDERREATSKAHDAEFVTH